MASMRPVDKLDGLWNRSARMSIPHQAALTALARKDRLRRLVSRTGLDFTSNDYLGLAESDALRDAAAMALARASMCRAESRT